MSRYLTPRQFARIAALGLVVLMATWAVFHSGRGKGPSIIAPLEREEADALVSELARCRTVKSDATAALESCRQVWAENRRQFFKPAKTTPSPAGSIPTPATVSGKIQDRLWPVEVEHQRSEVR
jgi:conjugative transfer region protein TrbK